MNDDTARKQAFIFAECIRSIAMQSKNMADYEAGRPPTYSPDDFFALAGFIDRIAMEITG